MYSEIAAAFQSGKYIVELIKTRKELSDSNELVTAVNDVQMKLSGAIAAALASQEKQASLAERVRELEAQLRDVEDRNIQMQSYELFEFPTKTLACKLKEEMASGKPLHYLCTACAEKKKKTTLQPLHGHLHCPESPSHRIWYKADPPITVPDPNSHS